MSGTSGADLSWVPALIISGRARRAQALPVMLILQIMPRRQTPEPAPSPGLTGSPGTTYDPATLTRHAVSGRSPQFSGGAGIVPVGASAADPDVFCLGSLLAVGNAGPGLLPSVQ